MAMPNRHPIRKVKFMEQINSVEEYNQTLESCDKSIVEQTALIEKVKPALERLIESDDWKLIVEEIYFEEESKRILDFLTSDSYYRKEVRESMLKKIDAIKDFRVFIKGLKSSIASAPAHINEIEVYRKKIKEEYAAEFGGKK